VWTDRHGDAQFPRHFQQCGNVNDVAFFHTVFNISCCQSGYYRYGLTNDFRIEIRTEPSPSLVSKRISAHACLSVFTKTPTDDQIFDGMFSRTTLKPGGMVGRAIILQGAGRRQYNARRCRGAPVLAFEVYSRLGRPLRRRNNTVYVHRCPWTCRRYDRTRDHSVYTAAERTCPERFLTEIINNNNNMIVVVRIPRTRQR